MKFHDLAILIQSRMGSKRFPGKSMVHIGEYSLLEHLLIGLKQDFSVSNIFVLTSNLSENKPIINCCKKLKINYVLGNENNVASRYYEFLKQNKRFDLFFRICGDSPFFDAELILKSYEEMKSSKRKLDFITSLPNKGNPQGQNIELFNKDVFLSNYKNFKNNNHFEHVTSFFYQNLNQFDYQFSSTKFKQYNYERCKFSIDIESDLTFMTQLHDLMNKKPYSYNLEELLDLAYKIK